MRLGQLFFLSLLAVLGFVCVPLALVAAQAPPDREDVRPAVRVTIGSRDDNWVYYTPESPDYNRVLGVLNRALPIYEQLTGLTWNKRIVIVYMGSGGSWVIGRMLDSREAYVTRKEPPVLYAADPLNCHIRIYAGWDTIPNFESVVARQFFHCFQMETGAAQIGDFADVMLNFWWLQGTAEWAASRVYPEQYPQDYHVGFFDPRQDIRKARYDAYYFWEFMASPRGLGSDSKVIIQMNMLRADGVFPLAVDIEAGELFHNWAQVLLDKQLPEPPILDLTAVDLSAGKGGSIQSSMPPFAVDYRNLINFDIQPGNVAVLTVSGLEAGQMAVSARMSGVTGRLQDNKPLEFCPPPEGLLLIMSRAEGQRNSTAPLTVTWTQQPSPNPCTPKPDEAETSATCIIGTWQVVDFPVTMMGFPADQTDLTGFTWTFRDDGSMSGKYAVVAKADKMQLAVDMPFSGNYIIQPMQEDPTLFAVSVFDWTFASGGTYIVTSDGKQTDFTKQFYELGQTMGWSPKGQLTCDGDLLSWDNADDFGGFVLTRIN